MLAVFGGPCVVHAESFDGDVVPVFGGQADEFRPVLVRS